MNDEMILRTIARHDTRQYQLREVGANRRLVECECREDAKIALDRLRKAGYEIVQIKGPGDETLS